MLSKSRSMPMLCMIPVAPPGLAQRQSGGLIFDSFDSVMQDSQRQVAVQSFSDATDDRLKKEKLLCPPSLTLGATCDMFTTSHKMQLGHQQKHLYYTTTTIYEAWSS